MATHALFIGWNRAIVGREQAAMENFNSAIAFFTKQVASGNLESFEPVILSAHGGDLNGFMLLRSDGEKLSQLRRNDEFLDLMTRCIHTVDGFGMIDGYVGQELMNMMGRWNKVISK